MLLLIDNYDSFTFNLAQYFYQLGVELHVVRNDQFELGGPELERAQAICISPGPGRPEDAGLSLAVIERYAGSIPLLGVCLGHQAIAQHFGASVVHAPEPRHGKTSRVEHDGRGLFEGIANPLTVCRYHSLCVSEQGLPECLNVSARSDDGVVMGIEHRSLPIFGVQFHPESILSDSGHALLKNFLVSAKLARV